MANTFGWTAPYSCYDTVVMTTCHLSNIANAGLSLPSCEFDNTASSNLLQYGKGLLMLPCSSATSTSGYLSLYMLTAVDGTNYSVGSSLQVPPASRLVATLAFVGATSSGTSNPLSYMETGMFTLEPALTKFIIGNSVGVALTCAGTTFAITSAQDQAN